jgi:hypothetical protein
MFVVLLTIHVLIWLFVVFAFINNETAKFNLIFVIPIIYILHMLPFHILNELKLITNKNAKEDTEKFEKFIGFYYIKKFFNKSFQNPLSPQGILILGSITSYFKLIVF